MAWMPWLLSPLAPTRPLDAPVWGDVCAGDVLAWPNGDVYVVRNVVLDRTQATFSMELLAHDQEQHRHWFSSSEATRPLGVVMLTKKASR